MTSLGIHRNRCQGRPLLHVLDTAWALFRPRASDYDAGTGRKARPGEPDSRCNLRIRKPYLPYVLMPWHELRPISTLFSSPASPAYAGPKYPMVRRINTMILTYGNWLLERRSYAVVLTTLGDGPTRR